MRGGEYLEVRASQGRLQVSRRGAVPLTFSLRHAVKPEAILFRSIEVFIGGIPGFDGGVEEGSRQGIYFLEIAHVHLNAIEVGVHVRPAPTYVAEFVPAIEVAPIAANVDDRIHGAG